MSTIIKKCSKCKSSFETLLRFRDIEIHNCPKCRKTKEKVNESIPYGRVYDIRNGLPTDFSD
jgi:ribosomal protein L34E